MRVVKPLKKQSFASYKIGEQKAARAAGQGRPDRANLLQQYKSMNAAPVRDIGTGNPAFRPKDAFGPPTLGPGAPLPSNTPNPAIISQPPMGADYNAGAGIMGGGTPAGTLSPRGGVTGGARPAPPMGGGMKKGGSVRAGKMASGGMTSKASSASKRGDGIAQRGKTRGKMC